VQENHPTHRTHAGRHDALHLDPRGFEIRFVHPLDEFHREHRIGTRRREEPSEATSVSSAKFCTELRRESDEGAAEGPQEVLVPAPASVGGTHPLASENVRGEDRRPDHLPAAKRDPKTVLQSATSRARHKAPRVTRVKGRW
jgi:hypothetical protein